MGIGDRYISVAVRGRGAPTRVENCGLSLHITALYIPYSSSTWQVPSSGVSQIGQKYLLLKIKSLASQLSGVIGQYPAELLKRLLIFHCSIYYSLLH